MRKRIAYTAALAVAGAALVPAAGTGGEHEPDDHSTTDAARSSARRSRSKGSCENGRKVTLYLKQDGKDDKVGTGQDRALGKGDTEGVWVISSGDCPGTTTPRSGEGNCDGDKSQDFASSTKGDCELATSRTPRSSPAALAAFNRVALMADSYDVIVIGGGPGGYVAAIRAAQLGLNTAVVEKDKPGGRCLNYACIPAKTMLHTAEVLDHAQNGAELGIKVTRASIDWKALADRRAAVSEGLSSGVKMLWDKNKVTQIVGEGSLPTTATSRSAARPTRPDGRAGHRLGRAADPGRRVLRSHRRHLGAWSLAAQPKQLAVVGAGASGSEIASAYARYGTEVTLIEMLPQILPLEDKDMARVVERTFKRQGIAIPTGTPISDVEDTGKSVKYKVGDTRARRTTSRSPAAARRMSRP